MKAQVYLLVIFVISIFFLIDLYIYLIFMLFYLPSIFIALYSIIQLRDNINAYSMNSGEDYFVENKIKKTTIDNLG